MSSAFNSFKLEQYKTDSSDAVCIKLVRKDTDLLDNSTTFHPEFSHQVYGPEEVVFGYKNLSVDLYYTAGSLYTYIGKRSDEVLDGKKYQVEIDNPLLPLVEYLPAGYTVSLGAFEARVSSKEEAGFVPPGELFHCFTNKGLQYEIYKCTNSTPGFREYHHRLRTFLIWFIDGANFLDDADNRWDFYLLFEKYKSDCGTSMRFATIGYASVYAFYAHPSKTRSRISQFIILPPFQSQGLGRQLLKFIYQDLRFNSSIKDIAVEEASDNFTALRDLVDCEACLKLKSWFGRGHGDDMDLIRKGLTTEMMAEAVGNLKLYKAQVRRVFEILCLNTISPSDKKLSQQYQDMIKARLRKSFKKCNDLGKMVRFLSPPELLAAISLQPENDPAVVETQVQENFDELINCYTKTLTKLGAVCQQNGHEQSSNGH